MGRTMMIMMFICLQPPVFAQFIEEWNINDYNECSNIVYDINGDTSHTVFCAQYRSQTYGFEATYCRDGHVCSLMIYLRDGCDRLVAEFVNYGKQWVRHDYHGPSVTYRRRLLRIYKKEKDKILYEQVWHESP